MIIKTVSSSAYIEELKIQIVSNFTQQHAKFVDQYNILYYICILHTI